MVQLRQAGAFLLTRTSVRPLPVTRQCPLDEGGSRDRTRAAFGSLGNDAGGIHEAIRYGRRSVDDGDRAGSACSRRWKHGSVGRRPRARRKHRNSDFTLEAGEFCDFTLNIAGTFSDSAVIFPDRSIHHFTFQFVHTNRDTGFTLTERDRVNEFTAADGQIKEVGLHLTFRNPDGKLVVVYAGLTVIDGEGNVLRFTPHIPILNADYATVLCTALGGSPAS
jgi:hypothetical protein